MITSALPTPVSSQKAQPSYSYDYYHVRVDKFNKIDLAGLRDPAGDILGTKVRFWSGRYWRTCVPIYFKVEMGYPTSYKVFKLPERGSQESLFLIIGRAETRLDYYDSVFLYQPTNHKLSLLAEALGNTDWSKAKLGRIREFNATRLRPKTPNGTYVRTWKFNRKLNRLVPGLWETNSKR